MPDKPAIGECYPKIALSPATETRHSKLIGDKTFFSKFQNSLHLLTLNAREPLEKVIYGRAAFEILEQSVHRYA